MIGKYLNAIYKDGARGETDSSGNIYYDCWGMTRDARVELYQKKLLHSRDGEFQKDPVGFTREYKKQAMDMREIEYPVAGCYIAVLRKKHLCTHVALVVHDINMTGRGLHVLDINPKSGTKLQTLKEFKELHSLRTIKYYDD